MSAPTFSITSFGDFGILAELSSGDAVTSAYAANFAADALRSCDGVLDSVAGIDSVAIRFHPSKLSGSQAAALLEKVLQRIPERPDEAPQLTEIPVCYGGEFGPDLTNLCEKLSLQPRQLIELHSSALYSVLTIGFAPGFAYLGPLPEALQTGRLASPRPRVPAGSVGIASAMTGVYPLASPGGWPLIGRTPKKLFEATAPNPFLFKPGASVRFVPIEHGEFSNADLVAT